MKKVFIALFTIAAFCFQAQAQVSQTLQCVPSMSVDEALSRYNAGIATASDKLSQDYQAAVTAHTRANADALSRYNQKVALAETTYSNEVREIREHLGLGWQEALEAAAAKHNQSVQAAVDAYAFETNANLDQYQQSTESAKANYQKTVDRLTAQYNDAVCASP